MTFVVTGGPVRNRGWVLERHLTALYKNGPDKLFYLVNDTTDNTTDILDGDSDIAYWIHNTGELGYTRDASDGPRYSSKNMGFLRNIWARQAMRKWPKATHLWVVDSDILPAPDVLHRLLDLNCNVAGAYVPIGDNVSPIHMTGWNARSGYARRTGEEKTLIKPHCVTLLGGCYLIKTGVFYDPVKFEDDPFRNMWGEHPQGEDGYFGNMMRDIDNTPMMVDPSARCQHIMKRDI